MEKNTRNEQRVDSTDHSQIKTTYHLKDMTVENVAERDAASIHKT